MTGHVTRRGAVRTGRLVGSMAAVAVLTLSVAGPAGAVKDKPDPRPSLPLNVQVQSGPGELVVSWSAPTYNGEWLNKHGVDVPYVITDYDLGGVPAKTWASCVDLNMTCTVTGLRPGHTYQVKVKVWNAKGRHSGWTVPVPGTPS